MSQKHKPISIHSVTRKFTEAEMKVIRAIQEERDLLGITFTLDNNTKDTYNSLDINTENFNEITNVYDCYNDYYKDLLNAELQLNLGQSVPESTRSKLIQVKLDFNQYKKLNRMLH